MNLGLIDLRKGDMDWEESPWKGQVIVYAGFVIVVVAIQIGKVLFAEPPSSQGYREVLRYEGTGFAEIRSGAGADREVLEEVKREVSERRYKLIVRDNHRFQLSGDPEVSGQKLEIQAGTWIYSRPHLILRLDESGEDGAIFRKYEVDESGVTDTTWRESGIDVFYGLK